MEIRTKTRNNILTIVAPMEISKSEITSLERSLFSNPIEQEDVFGISRAFSDKYNSLTKEITPESVKYSFLTNGGRCFKDKNDKIGLRISKEIKTAEQLYVELEKIKKGKIIKTLLGLWFHAKEIGSFVFRDVRLTELMTLVLKPDKNGYFSQEQKRDFTEAIYILRGFEIYLDNPVTEKDKNGKQKRMVKRDYFRLIDLTSAVYATKRDGTADDSVIVKLNGELLPRFNKAIMRGRLYGIGLLELDANKDENALLLGFNLSTRFDQLRQGKKGKHSNYDDRLFIKMDRKKLIELTGYDKTDSANKAMASRCLEKTLNKLIQIKCIKNYSPCRIGTDDNIKISIQAFPLNPEMNDFLGVSV
jgi:hypothetical protein